jgi:hypothetical protein
MINAEIKFRLYNILITPVHLYENENWVLIESYISQIATFKRKVIRRIMEQTKNK